MMSRARSNLIEDFLVAVVSGQISAEKETQGYEALDGMLKALCSIVSGHCPDKVFGITRNSGRPADTRNLIISVMIHGWKLDGHQWSGIEVLVNDWLRKRHEPILSVARLKQIYKENDGAEIYDSIKNYDWSE